MGFIGKLLSTVSSAVLILLGASGASASTSPQGAAQKQQQQLPSVRGGAAELLAGFIVDTGGRYTEDVVEAAVRRMLDGMSPDRVAYLPGFVRGLRSLGLSPEVEVAAVETLISMLEEQSGLQISAEQAAAVAGQVFDEFVEPFTVAEGESPTGKFVTEEPLPDDDSLRVLIRPMPFLPS
jgi:hypothetical protein